MVYDPILNSEIDAESPITESLVTRIRDNPEAVHAGDPTVPDDKRILFPVAMRTDEVDVTARAAPDGMGGVKWVGGGFEGNGMDGIITAITKGEYHATSGNISTPQTPTGFVEIHVEDDIVISGTIVSSLRLVIKAGGNVTLSGAITCRGLEVRCGGNLSISAALNAHSGSTPDIENGEYDEIGVARFYVGGDMSITSTVIANDILAFVLGDAEITDTVTALWLGSGSILNTGLPGTGWGTLDGSGENNGNTHSSTGSGGDGGGGGGGTGGGYGGRVDGLPGVRAPGDRMRGGHQLYALPMRYLRRGGGAGSSRDVSGGDGGGRISLYVDGDLDMTGGQLIAVGEAGISSGSQDSGGGGGGTVRVACKGTINNGVFPVDGGDGGPADGGGGGGGGSFLVASGYSGTQTQTSTGGSSSQGEFGETGTIIKDTRTADQIQDLVGLGVFDV